MSKHAVHVVGYVEVFTKDQTRERTQKFIRELVEQGFLNILEDEGIDLANKNAAVSAESAVERFERHFRSPAMKKRFKALFKKVFPL